MVTIDRWSFYTSGLLGRSLYMVVKCINFGPGGAMRVVIECIHLSILLERLLHQTFFAKFILLHIVYMMS